MHIRTLLLGSSALFLAGATTAHAEPITAALFGAAFASTTAGAFVSLAFGIAANVGASLWQRARAKRQQAQSAGVKVTIEAGDDKPVSAVLGYYATAGQRAYAGSWGRDGKTPNAFFVDVIELGNLPGQVVGIWVNSEKCTLLTDSPDADLGFPVEQYTDDGGTTHLWVKFYDGTQTESDAYLLEKFGGLEERPYSDDMIGYGCPYAIVTARFNQELHKGIPKLVFEMESTPVYDLRSDSTGGGLGAQRWANKATWAGSSNPATLIYNIIRGMYHDGEWFYGGRDLAAFRLPASSWIAGANACDVDIDLAAGGSEPAFRAGYEIRGDEPPLEAIQKIARAGNIRLAEVGGVFKIQVGAPGSAVYSFTDDDIIITQGQSFEPFPSIDETVNGIEAVYPEPLEAWANKDAPARYDAALEVEDGDRRLTKSVTLDACPYPNQVQRLQEVMLRDARKFRIHQFYLPPDAYVLEPTDVVAWSSVRTGYINKKFEVVSIVGQPTMLQLVTLREIDPADHDWSSDLELPSTNGWIGVIRPPVQAFDGWQAEPATIFDENGLARRPTIKVLAPDDLDDVRNVRVRVRRTGTTQIVFDSDSLPYGEPYEWLLNGSFLPGTAYEVQGELVPYTNRKTAPSEWIEVTTPNVRLGDADVYPEGLIADIEQWIEDSANFLGAEIDALEADLIADAAALVALAEQQAADAAALASDIAQEATDRATAIDAEADARVADGFLLGQSYRNIRSTVEELVALVNNQQYLDFDQREEQNNRINLRLSTTEATFDERITVAVSQTAAVAQRTTLLEASTGSLSSQIATVETAYTTADAALAQQITLLSAGTDNQFDPAKIWYFDTGVEGWTGNGTPTASLSWIRPANQASDPYITSPEELGVNALTYGQVRARIRKYGTTTWEGYVWWKAVGDTTWDAARRITVSEPSYDGNGIGLITANMTWTGTISQIRIDLSTAADATNYFTLDWVAIGRPSPGASTAELLEERTARISADAALSELVTNLNASLTGTQTGLTGLTSTVDALSSTVTELDGDLTALGTALTAVEAEVDGKASSEALDLLTAEVSALGGGGIVSQGESIRAIRSTLEFTGLEALNQGYRDLQGDANSRQAVTDASQSLTTRIEATNDSLTLVATAVTQVQAALPGLATAAGLSALDTRVTVTETTLTSQASAITSINSDLAGKASATGLSDLTTRVTETESDIAGQASEISSITSAITSINSELAGKANTTALNTLTTRVTTAEGEIDALSSDITSLTSTVAGKANTSALNALTTRVTATENSITAINSDITSLETDIAGKASTSALNSLTTRVTTAETTLDGKNSVFRQTSAPTARAPGDLWFDTDDSNKPYRWTGTGGGSFSWVSVQDANIPALLSTTSAQATQITNLTATVDGKASISSVNTLGGRVTATENSITAINSDITSLTTTVNGKASTTAVNSLTTRVTTAEASLGTKNRTFRQSSAPTPDVPGDEWIDTDDKNKRYRWTGTLASGSWVSVQDGNIPDLLSTTAAQAEQLTSLTSTVGNFSASGRFRVSTLSTPSGATARIGLSVAASSGAATETASMYLEALTGGGSRIVFDADKVIMTNGSARKAPFIFTDGTLFLRDVNIQNADIGNLTVGTSNIQPGAVSRQAYFSSTEGVTGSRNQWIVAMDITIQHDLNSPPVLLFATATGARVSGFDGLRWRDRTANVVLREGDGTVETDRTWTGTFVHQPPPSRTSTRYQIEVRMPDRDGEGGARDLSLIGLALVR